MSKETKLKNNIEKMSFETALSKLEDIVEKLGNGQVELEKMVELYQEGILLKEHCNKKLADAQMDVKNLVKESSKV